MTKGKSSVVCLLAVGFCISSAQADEFPPDVLHVAWKVFDQVTGGIDGYQILPARYDYRHTYISANDRTIWVALDDDFNLQRMTDHINFVFAVGHEATHELIFDRSDILLYPSEAERVSDAISLLNLLRNVRFADWLSQHPDEWNIHTLNWTGGRGQPDRMTLMHDLLDASLDSGHPDRRKAIFAAIGRSLPQVARARSDSVLRERVKKFVSALFPQTN